MSKDTPILGSGATHALMSHVSVPVEIITLLEGERKVDKPIHKAEYYKPLEMQNLQKALAVFSAYLSKFRK